MEEYNRFLGAYEKNFVRNRNFRITLLISTTEDIPSDTREFQEVISHAYGFLKVVSEKPLLNIGRKMKTLFNYQQLLQKNNEGEKRTSAIEFSTVLYMLHYYTLRILRSPWRKDFLTIKTYNGYFLHTTSYVSTATMYELFSAIGFRRSIANGTLEFEHVRLNGNVLHELKEVGAEFFLSYVHCLMLHDSVFRNRVKDLSKDLLDFSVNTGPKVPTRNKNSNAEASGAKIHPSHSRSGGTESFEAESHQVSNILMPIRTGMNNKVDFQDLRDRAMYEAPLDLSVNSNHRRPQTMDVMRHAAASYRHEYAEIDKKYTRPLSGSSDDLDDRALYGSDTNTIVEPKLYEESHADHLQLSLENPVLYPPTDVKISRTYDTKGQLLPPQTNYVGRSTKKTAVRPPLDVQMAQQANQVLQISERGYPSNGVASHSERDILVPPAGNYVKFTPSIAQERGRPDGEYTKNMYRHVDNSKHIQPNAKDTLRNKDRIRHIYHDVKPDSYKSNGALS